MTPELEERMVEALVGLSETQARLLEIAEYDHALIRAQFEVEGAVIDGPPCDHPVDARAYPEEGANLRIDCTACGAVGIHGTGVRVMS